MFTVFNNCAARYRGKWRWFATGLFIFAGGCAITARVLHTRWRSLEIIVESSIHDGVGDELVCYVKPYDIGRQHLSLDRLISEVTWQLNGVGITLDAALTQFAHPDQRVTDIERLANDQHNASRPPGNGFEEIVIVIEVRRFEGGAVADSVRGNMIIGGTARQEIYLNSVMP